MASSSFSTHPHVLDAEKVLVNAELNRKAIAIYLAHMTAMTIKAFQQYTIVTTNFQRALSSSYSTNH